MARRVGWFLAICAISPVAVVLLISFLPGEHAARLVSAVASRYLQTAVAMESVDIRAFSVSPGVSITGLMVQEHDASAALLVQSAWLELSWQGLLRSQPVIDRLRIDEANLSLASTQAARPGLVLLHRQYSENTQLSRFFRGLSNLRIRELLLDRLMLVDDSASPEPTIKLRISGAASTHDPGIDTLLQVDGELDGQSLLVTAVLPHLHYILDGFPEDALAAELDVAVDWGDSRLEIVARAGKPAAFEDVEAVFSLKAEPAGDGRPLWTSTALAFQPFALSGKLVRGKKDWLLHDLEGQWGQSDVNGEIRVDTTRSPRAVDARLSSAVLHAGDFILLMSAGDQAESVMLALPANMAEVYAHYGSLLQVVDGQRQKFQGSIDYRAEQVVVEDRPLNMLDLTVEQAGQQLILLINRVGLDDGLVEGRVDVRFDGATTTSAIDLFLKRFLLVPDLPGDSDPESLVGRLAAHLQLVLAGDDRKKEMTVREGQLQALAAGGDVLAALAGMMGLSSLPDLPGQDRESADGTVECSFTELEFEEQDIDIATLVFMTPTSVYLGEGSLSLNDVSMDVMLESHPTVASTKFREAAWQFSGSLMEPLRKPASPLFTRESAAAVLADIVSPAARLLPYLDTGNQPRHSELCSGMANALQ